VSPPPRVVITGLGALTPLGYEKDTMWRALLEGRSGIAPITRFDTSKHDVHFGGEIRDFDPARWLDAKEAKRLDRSSQFGMAAADEAVRDAGIRFDACDRSRIGCILGLGIGGLAEMEEQQKRFLEKGPSRVSPFLIPKMMVNATPGCIAIRYGIRGPNFDVSSACASANHAIGVAFRLIRYGDADAIITGGVEAALTPLALAGFSNMGALSTRNEAPEKASRPFEKNRDGFVLSEGAGLLVFERLDHALRRGARIYAEVVGFGMSDDAHHITAPDPAAAGGELSMRLALRDAGRSPDDVSYINAHGTSTPLNDKAEALAIRTLLGDRARRVPVNSTKSMIGHTLGAAAGIELVVACLSIAHQKVHPTINYETPDPECDLDVVPNVAREHAVDLALSNSLGFGGHNATVAVSRYVERG
jgi:3-oxoacyl-[acyl-carrier-protein] synthase II